MQMITELSSKISVPDFLENINKVECDDSLKIIMKLSEGIMSKNKMDATLQSFIIVGVMFCLSYTRGYVLRRFFNKRSR